MIIFTPKRQSTLYLQNARAAPVFFRAGIRNALYKIGLDSVRHASSLINNEGRTGRTYFINGTPHVASGPGEAPANRTGKLKRSFNYLVRGVTELEWGNEISYAASLEHGTKRMAPRQFLTPTHEKLQSQVVMDLEEEVDNAIKRRR